MSSQLTPLAGVQVLQRQTHQDSRGYFERLFCAETLQTLGWSGAIAQITRSCTRQVGAVRGLHYQLPPFAEYKLVSCLRGEVWDLALDLRAGSATFLQWHALHLTPENGRALLIPPGCAHGFQNLRADSELLYCHSAPYRPESEAGVHALDPALNIAWPLAVSQMSEKDANFPMLSQAFQGVLL